MTVRSSYFYQTDSIVLYVVDEASFLLPTTPFLEAS